MVIFKVMKKKNLFISILIILLLVSCASFKIRTLGYNEIVGYQLTDGLIIKVDTLTLSQYRWKLQKDRRMQFNYLQYVLDQNMNWHYNYYWTNNMYRRGFRSPFDFYWRRFDIWNAWSFNSHHWWGHEWYKPINHYRNTESTRKRPTHKRRVAERQTQSNIDRNLERIVAALKAKNIKIKVLSDHRKEVDKYKPNPRFKNNITKTNRFNTKSVRTIHKSSPRPSVRVVQRSSSVKSGGRASVTSRKN